MTAAVLLEGEQQSSSDKAAPYKEEQLHKSGVPGISQETPSLKPFYFPAVMITTLLHPSTLMWQSLSMRMKSWSLF
jgi:hypothetical protein